VPRHRDVQAFTRTAGRRCLALAFLLGKREEPLAEMARQLGISRASLSTYARELEDRTGLHSRGQKCSGSRNVYRENAKRSWKLRRLNTAMADAVGE
jgi:DNA-binding CsgD family transcriptional regulator